MATESHFLYYLQNLSSLREYAAQTMLVMSLEEMTQYMTKDHVILMYEFFYGQKDWKNGKDILEEELFSQYPDPECAVRLCLSAKHLCCIELNDLQFRDTIRFLCDFFQATSEKRQDLWSGLFYSANFGNFPMLTKMFMESSHKGTLEKNRSHPFNADPFHLVEIGTEVLENGEKRRKLVMKKWW